MIAVGTGFGKRERGRVGLELVDASRAGIQETGRVFPLVVKRYGGRSTEHKPVRSEAKHGTQETDGRTQ